MKIMEEYVICMEKHFTIKNKLNMGLSVRAQVLDSPWIGNTNSPANKNSLEPVSKEGNTDSLLGPERINHN